jgi:uncharacterized protein YjiS (DUF1127 family)
MMEEAMYGEFRLSVLDRRGDGRRGATARRITLLTAIRRIVAAIRLWRGRAHSRQQLRGLNDHLLNDIGLRRELVLGYEFPAPLW